MNRDECIPLVNYNSCLLAKCDSTTQILKNNKCEDCPKCESPDFTRTSCYRDFFYNSCIKSTCNNLNEITLLDGSCFKCHICE